MIDDENICFAGFFSGLHHKTVFVVRTVFADTVFGGTSNRAPNSRAFRDRCDVASFSGFRDLHEFFNFEQMRQFFSCRASVFDHRMFETGETNIVGPAF